MLCVRYCILCTLAGDRMTWCCCGVIAMRRGWQEVVRTICVGSSLQGVLL